MPFSEYLAVASERSRTRRRSTRGSSYDRPLKRCATPLRGAAAGGVPWCSGQGSSMPKSASCLPLLGEGREVTQRAD